MAEPMNSPQEEESRRHGPVSQMKIMNSRQAVILCLVAVLTYSCTYREVEVTSIDNIRLRSVSSRSIGLDVYLSISNPNHYTFRIRSIDLDIVINQHPAGKIINTESTVIEARSVTTYTFRFDYTSEHLWKDALSMIRAVSSGTAQVGIEGEIVIGTSIMKKVIPVNRETTIENIL